MNLKAPPLLMFFLKTDIRLGELCIIVDQYPCAVSVMEREIGEPSSKSSRARYIRFRTNTRGEGYESIFSAMG